MSWYRTGTISVTAASATVTGTDTLWFEQVIPGDILFVGQRFCEISAVVSDTELTLMQPYGGATVSGAYAIIRNFTSYDNFLLITRMEGFLSDRDLSLEQMTAWMTGTETGGPLSDGVYPLTDRFGNVHDAVAPAKLQADSQNVITLTQAALDNMNANMALIEAAGAEAQTAQDAATLATAKANAASASATAADDSKGAAALSETNAAQSEADALLHKQSIVDDAAQTAADRVQTGLDRTATSADRVLAESARTSAQTAQGASESARDSASGFNDAAQLAKTAAEAAKTDAETAATTTAGHVTTTTANKTAAETAETNAAASATEALGFRNETEGFKNDAAASALSAEQSAQIVANGMYFVSTWDASTGAYPPGPAGTGYPYYKVSVSGTVSGADFAAGDSIIWDGVGYFKIDSTDMVASVNGQIGAVVLTKDDVGLGKVDDTSDANKPVSTAQQAALNDKLDKSGDTMTGTLALSYGTPSLVLAETDYSPAVEARIALVNGSMYVQAPQNSTLRLTGYFGADINGVTARINGDHRELFHTGNQLALGTTAESARTAIDLDEVENYPIATFNQAANGAGAAYMTPQRVQQAVAHYGNRLRLSNYGAYHKGDDNVNVDLAQAGDMGLYYAGSPGTYPDTGAGYYWISTQSIYGGNVVQTAVGYSPSGPPNISYRYGRTDNPTVWSAWTEVWTDSNFDPDTKQDSLGFVPIEQGGGTGMSANKVRLGWSGSELMVQVDQEELGHLVRNGRNLIAGEGLTGGGNLNDDRTFRLGTPRTLSGTSLNDVTDESHTHALSANLSAWDGVTPNTKVDDTDNRLSDDRQWTASTVSQAEAEAGTAGTRRAWTAKRVRQAIAAFTEIFTSGEKSKLSGIDSGATANASNAQLRDRDTHSGTQAISTVSGLQSVLDDLVSQQQVVTWVNFNGRDTVAIRDSNNVSSITDVGLGRYRINFATNMANPNYVPSMAVASGEALTPVVSGTAASGSTDRTVTGFEISTYSTIGSRVDFAEIYVAVSGGN